MCLVLAFSSPNMLSKKDKLDLVYTQISRFQSYQSIMNKLSHNDG